MNVNKATVSRLQITALCWKQYGFLFFLFVLRTLCSFFYYVNDFVAQLLLF